MSSDFPSMRKLANQRKIVEPAGDKRRAESAPDDGRYKCKFCPKDEPKTFAHWDDLVAHVRYRHPVEWRKIDEWARHTRGL